MTLHDLMPAVFLSLAFIFFIVYALSRVRLMLVGCGASFFALCPSLLDLPVFVSVGAYFLYIGFVYAAISISRHVSDVPETNAIMLNKTDNNGGYILYKGEVRRAVPRDSLYEYALGDVLTVIVLSNGTLCAYRL